MQLTHIFILITIGVCSYLIGSVNFALIISSLRSKDVRDLGSGNPGTMNMLRNFGAKLGALTFVLDIIKGALPVFIAGIIFGSALAPHNFDTLTLNLYIDISRYVAGLFVIVGHIYPVFFKFKGGKGVASTLGVFLVVNWQLTLIAFAVSFFYILLFEYGSVGNLAMITIMCCVEGYRYNINYSPDIYLFLLCILILCICFLTWFAHRGNLYRLMMGKEHKTRLRDIIKPKRRTKGSND